MTHIQISFLILAFAYFVKVIATQDFNSKQSNDFVSQFQDKISFLEKKIFDLVKANEDITNTAFEFEKRVQKLEENNQILIESSESHFVELDETIGEIVSKVEDMASPIVFSAYKEFGTSGI